MYLVLKSIACCSYEYMICCVAYKKIYRCVELSM